MGFNPSRMVNEADLDTVTANNRVRATNSNVTVRSVTFSALPLGVNYVDGAGVPVSVTSTANHTLDTGQILSGICVLKPTGGAATLTFDTAAQIVAGVNQVTAGAQVGDYITTLLINGSTVNTIAPTTTTGVTFDTNQANTTIAANTSRYMFFRLTNVTAGSEAVVAYW